MINAKWLRFNNTKRLIAKTNIVIFTYNLKFKSKALISNNKNNKDNKYNINFVFIYLMGKPHNAIVQGRGNFDKEN